MTTAESQDPKENTNVPVVQVHKTRRILFAVHRYAPYEGGPENFVRDMAEETFNQGHKVMVFADEHKGHLKGIAVTSDPAVLLLHWDLIVVHGADDWIRYNVLDKADKLGGPVLYLIVNPSDLAEWVSLLHRVSYVGCSTLADWRYVQAYGAQARAVRIRHGINIDSSVGDPGFCRSHGIKTRYVFMSTGGYWPNKAFDELVGVFKDTGRTDATLVLTGYENRYSLMQPDSEYVRSFLLEKRSEMLSLLMEADLYIMNSYTEGFGLTLLESMLNLTPWVGREIAGAELMREYGFTYTNPKELQLYLQLFMGATSDHLVEAQRYVISTHLIKHTVSDILRLLQ